MKRVVIAGGTGTIGRALTRRLTDSGWQVVLLSRSSGQSGRTETVQWTPGERGDWEEALDGADAVVQLTGESLAAGRWTAARKRRFHASRVTASRVLAEAVVDRGATIRCFVQGSAVGYYGDRGDERLDEGSGAGEGYLADLCVAWEDASRVPIEGAGIRWLAARTGLVLAAGGALIRQISRPFRFGVGGPIGSGRQWMPWIHLQDEAAALQFLLQVVTVEGPVNLVSPGAVTNEEFSRTLAGVLRRPSWLRAPEFALRLALGEMSSLAVEGQCVVPSRLQAAGFPFGFPQLEPALEDVLI